MRTCDVVCVCVSAYDEIDVFFCAWSSVVHHQANQFVSSFYSCIQYLANQLTIKYPRRHRLAATLNIIVSDESVMECKSNQPQPTSIQNTLSNSVHVCDWHTIDCYCRFTCLDRYWTKAHIFRAKNPISRAQWPKMLLDRDHNKQPYWCCILYGTHHIESSVHHHRSLLELSLTSILFIPLNRTALQHADK